MTAKSLRPSRSVREFMNAGNLSGSSPIRLKFIDGRANVRQVDSSARFRQARPFDFQDGAFIAQNATPSVLRTE
jgi:hypothetical protein